MGSALIATAASATTPASSIPGAPADEAAIRAIFLSEDKAGSAHRAADLDWENAFGVRYTDLAKRDAFYGANVTPLQSASVERRLEVKIRFFNPTLAVADVYKRRVGQLDVATHKPGPDRWLRVTAVLEKCDGAWIEVLERIADLRLPWYVHYDAIPAAVPVPAQTLARWAGAYHDVAGQPYATVSVAAGHLVMDTGRRSYVVVPTSADAFLSFDPDDLAEYDKIAFATDSAGHVKLTLTDMVDAPVIVLTKAE